MSDQLLVVLQICLLALVYLVFLRVVRAVWVELRAEQPLAPVRSSRRGRRNRAAAPAPAPAAAPRRTPVGAARLVVVAPADLAGRSFPLADETTIGRAAGCAVAIDDAHVSKLHARLTRHQDGWVLEDLGSTNGTLLDGALVTTPTRVSPGSRVQIGEVLLELV